MATELKAETQHGITHVILKVSKYAQRLRGERARYHPNPARSVSVCRRDFRSPFLSLGLLIP